MQPLKLENGYVISSNIYRVYDCLSMLGLKLFHVSKTGPQQGSKLPENSGHLALFQSTASISYDSYLHIQPSGPRLNIKTVLSTYGDFHVKDKTAVRTSYL